MATATKSKGRAPAAPRLRSRETGQDKAGNPIEVGCLVCFDGAGDVGVVTFVDGDAVVYTVLASEYHPAVGKPSCDMAGSSEVLLDKGRTADLMRRLLASTGGGERLSIDRRN